VTLPDPEFVAGSQGWSVSRRAGRSRVTVARGGAERGNHVWTDFPEPLTKGGGYRLKIDWTPTTAGATVNLHLRKPEDQTFHVIGEVEVGETSGKPRVDTVDFIVPEAGYSQFMLGALHFTGRKAGAEIRSIELIQVPAAALAAARDDKGGAPAAEALAIPPNTPNREQIILNVINDPQVQQLKDRILSVVPELTLYVGREMKEYTWNKVGGPADLLALPQTVDQFQRLVELAIENDVPYRVLGRGSNVIVRDGGIRGLVILTGGLNEFRLEEGKFIAGAGASFIEASYFLLENGLSSLEWASGIPGTVGGAVFMNAGTNVSDVRATIESVTYLDSRGQIKVAKKHDIVWGKRFTTFQQHPNWIILEATFLTTPADKDELSKKMTRTVQVRESHFPLESPNHGSTFKWWRAPRLIMQSGLKGYRIGGVQISTKQPGFFVNVNQATASDYEALVNYTIARVYEHSGFLLEPEVEFIGERPHRYERYTTESPVTDLEKKATGPQA
uniref:UDP-N-acetylmuramate dehydrogenase n=1 Tax=Demequina sp. NBRC 110057 TaxID=1570346 RepID=UPI001F2124F8